MPSSLCCRRQRRDITTALMPEIIATTTHAGIVMNQPMARKKAMNGASDAQIATRPHASAEAARFAMGSAIEGAELHTHSPHSGHLSSTRSPARSYPHFTHLGLIGIALIAASLYRTRCPKAQRAARGGSQSPRQCGGSAEGTNDALDPRPPRHLPSSISGSPERATQSHALPSPKPALLRRFGARLVATGFNRWTAATSKPHLLFPYLRPLGGRCLSAREAGGRSLPDPKRTAKRSPQGLVRARRAAASFNRLEVAEGD
jgi:hypothetical protein